MLCIQVLTLLWLPVGDMYEIGAEKGKYYSVNVPLRDGIDDQSESWDGACLAVHESTGSFFPQTSMLYS